MVSPRDMSLPLMGSAMLKERMPAHVEKLISQQKEIVDRFLDGQANDTTEGPIRYLAYFRRLRNLAVTSQRYLAYTSDIGESMRPVVPRPLINCAYLITSLYIIGDVANEGIKAYHRNMRVLAPATEAYHDATTHSAYQFQPSATHHVQRVSPEPSILQETLSKNHPQPWKDPEIDTEGEILDGVLPWSSKKIPMREDWRAVIAERATFQVLASLVLPAITIHSAVRYGGKALKNATSPMLRRWGPVGLGLAIIPMLPYTFDKPVQKFVRGAFDTLYESFEGPGITEDVSLEKLPSSHMLKTLAQEKEMQAETDHGRKL
ncbi:hypothetical protein KEM55_004648 [Ascosphaera atra]|nr:hypothetical protein KEM55_004648 [Ascosphaera atra]